MASNTEAIEGFMEELGEDEEEEDEGKEEDMKNIMELKVTFLAVIYV